MELECNAMKKVYLKEYIHPEAVKVLKAQAEIVTDFDKIEEIDAIITRGEDIDRDLIQKASALKVIGKHGVGYENIDIQAAREMGVRVIYTPGCNTHSVAELAVGFMLDVSRNITLAQSSIKAGATLDIAPKEMEGRELQYKTVGFIGMGKIAQEVSQILRHGFSMKAIGYDPYLSAEKAEQLGFEKKEQIEDVLKEADIVHITLPLNDETRGLIGEAEFSAMKPGSILINTARGGIVDETALYAALKEGNILGGCQRRV